jgi:hypothetical protein
MSFGNTNPGGIKLFGHNDHPQLFYHRVRQNTILVSQARIRKTNPKTNTST